MQQKEINIQELAFEFLMNLSDTFTLQEQAEILTYLNLGINNGSEIIKIVLDPEKREQMLQAGKSFIEQNQGKLTVLESQVHEHFN